MKGLFHGRKEVIKILENKEYELWNGDCLELMKDIPDKSIDMILCDLPYGTTKCKWDVILPFNNLWEQYNRIVKENGAIILFGTEPFSSELRLSNKSDYKYDIYWVKEKPTNFMQVKKRVGKLTENICVFYKKQCTYNPQMVKHNGKKVTNKPSERNAKFKSVVASDSPTLSIKPYEDTGYRYPCDILNINREKLGSTVHPTQKPVELLEWLIKTYTQEGEIVLDNCMGSGSTGVAALNINRKFIGMELDEKYFQIAEKRIQDIVQTI